MVHCTACSLCHTTTCSLLETYATYSTYFCLACVINIQHISSHKMTFIGLEPQWYIAQRVVFTTRPLARCWKTTASYSTYFCVA
jgi:hypothetical protein